MNTTSQSEFPKQWGGVQAAGRARRLTVALLLTVGCSLTGCAGEATDLPKLATVKGLVTLNGSPLANAIVEFYPDAGTPSSGKTDGQGKFALKYSQGQDGAITASHRVKITETVELSGAGGDGPPPKVGQKELRSFDWADKVTVVKGENTFDFALKGK